MARLRLPLFALAATAGAAALAGCASNAGDFPSLAQRPAEREYAAEQMAPPKVRPALPDDPSVAAKAGGFVAAAREAEGAFARAFETASAAVARAGPPESDSWVIAQEEISRAIAAQAPATRIAGQLDDYAAARARETPLSPGDVARIEAATAELHRISEDQTARLRRLEASLHR